MRSRLEFALETVTPMFLGGADPYGAPELRVASVRGALRFWLRALLGGVLGNDPEKVFRRESQVFGSTDHASPVIVRIEKPYKLRHNSFNPLPHKQPRFLFEGFEPGQRFDLLLLSRDQDALQQAESALWLLCHLGGLGRRSRRGFGSLQITRGKLAITAKTLEELADGLKQKLARLLHNSPAMARIPRFPSLHPKWAQVKVHEREFERWGDAVKLVMNEAHKHKNPALGFANPRQASPVHIHVAKLQTGKYVLVLTTMLSSFNEKLLSRADRQRLVDFLAVFHGKVVFGFKEVPKEWPGGTER